MTIRVIVIHHVQDYDQWRRHFDAAHELRRRGGELDFEVLTGHAEPCLVVHQATWSSAQAAIAFFESPEVIAVRIAAGAETPQFLYLDSDPQEIS